MFYVGYLFGALSSGLLLLSGVFLSRKLLIGEASSPVAIVPSLRGAQKRTPKSHTEAELWLKEQKEPRERM